MTTKFYPTVATPGADSNNYTLFDSTSFSPGSWRQAAFKRMILDLPCDQNGTLVEEKSNDDGATWIAVSSEAITAAAATSTYREYAVEPYDDWRLYWTNGGSAQTLWGPSVSGDSEAL